MARTDCVCPDVVGSVLHCELARQTYDGRLAGLVDQHACFLQERVHRSDVDDRTATATSHVRHCVFGCEIQRLHQDIDAVVPILLFNRERVAVDSRFCCDHAESVVHEYVQASELLNRFVDHALEVGG